MKKSKMIKLLKMKIKKLEEMKNALVVQEKNLSTVMAALNYLIFLNALSAFFLAAS